MEMSLNSGTTLAIFENLNDLSYNIFPDNVKICNFRHFEYVNAKNTPLCHKVHIIVNYRSIAVASPHVANVVCSRDVDSLVECLGLHEWRNVQFLENIWILPC